MASGSHSVANSSLASMITGSIPSTSAFCTATCISSSPWPTSTVTAISSST